MFDFIRKILEFIFPRQFDTEEDREPEDDDREEEGGSDQPDETEDIYYRKITKIAMSERRGSGRVDIFAVTFEDNDADRFRELVTEIESYAERHHLFTAGEYGYDDQSAIDDPPFEYPAIEVGEE